jgi:hypothetical protein
MFASRAISSAASTSLKNLLVEPGRQTPIVVDDTRAAVAEDEPPRDDEAQSRHVAEIARDRFAACRHAEVGTPDIDAEVQAVENGLAVSGPGIVHTVNEL